MNGVILKGIGGLYFVLINGAVTKCKASGRLRIGDLSPVAGDRVEVDLQADVGLILKILPRKNSFVRPPIANIDKLFITASEAHPVTDPYLIDKMLLIALYQDVEPIILLTKSDICSSQGLKSIYQACGFKVILCSAESGQGVAEIVKETAGCISVFSGNSGVGKSSILNKVFTGFNLETGAISSRTHRGKQTTRATEFLQLGNGGVVADTPGFSSFDLSKMQHIDKEYLMHLFPEFKEYWNKCRFMGCTHRKEPNCAVKQGLLDGEIHQSRYDNYVKLYSELEQQKEW